MIARIWTGVVASADGDVYARYIQDTGFEEYTRTAGNLGGWLLRRDSEGQSTFIALSLWESVEAVRAFAGDDEEHPVLYPLDERYLVEGSAALSHYDVLAQAGPAPEPGDLSAA